MHDHLFEVGTSCTSRVACHTWYIFCICMETLYLAHLAVRSCILIELICHVVRLCVDSWWVGTTIDIGIDGSARSIQRARIATWFLLFMHRYMGSIFKTSFGYHGLDAVFSILVSRELKLFLLQLSLFFCHSLAAFLSLSSRAICRAKKEIFVICWSCSGIVDAWWNSVILLSI